MRWTTFGLKISVRYVPVTQPPHPAVSLSNPGLIAKKAVSNEMQAKNAV